MILILLFVKINHCADYIRHYTSSRLRFLTLTLSVYQKKAAKHCWGIVFTSKPNMLSFLLSILFLFSLQLPYVKSQDGNITFIFMLSRPSTEGSFLLEENTAGVQPAVDMALDYINERDGLLSDYSLSYGEVAVNSQVIMHAGVFIFQNVFQHYNCSYYYYVIHSCF